MSNQAVEPSAKKSRSSSLHTVNTHPASAAVFGSSDVLGDRMAFVEANGHGVADRHVCGTNSTFQHTTAQKAEPRRALKPRLRPLLRNLPSKWSWSVYWREFKTLVMTKKQTLRRSSRSKLVFTLMAP